MPITFYLSRLIQERRDSLNVSLMRFRLHARLSANTETYKKKFTRETHAITL